MDELLEISALESKVARDFVPVGVIPETGRLRKVAEHGD